MTVVALRPTPDKAVAKTTRTKPARRGPFPFVNGGEIQIGGDVHGADAIAALPGHMGSSNALFALELFHQLGNAVSKGAALDEDKTNFALGVVTGIAPRDEIEAMLAAQMAAVHLATMTAARRLTHAETLSHLECHEKAFNKLARTFAAQTEALKRYRSKGEQRVIVERVVVNEGGQAIVGHVDRRGGGEDEAGR